MDLAARRPGPDVVRALAMAGVVVMNYHGYLIIRGGQQFGTSRLYDWFDPWTGPFATRFAATFVLTAGVGITLMTRSSVGDPVRTRQMSWRLVRRGFVLYVGGMLLEQWWPGTILPFYGAMFVLAAVLWRLSSWAVGAVGVTAALAGWALRWWRLDLTNNGSDADWLFAPAEWSPGDLVFGIFVNGTHPLVPWLLFLCAGILVGRHVVGSRIGQLVALVLGVVLFILARIVSGAAASGDAEILLSVDPFDRGIVYSASALGTALVAFAIVSIVAQAASSGVFGWLIDALQRAGQLSLTIYVAHALVFLWLVDSLGVIGPGGIGKHLWFAIVFWLVTTAGAVAYQHRFGRGPLERAYRAITY